ncbi:MAG: hypothetical protein RSB95_05320 [Bacilli bacterium]
MKRILLFFLMLIMSACSTNTSQHDKMIRQEHDYIYQTEKSDEQDQAYQVFAIPPRTDTNYFSIYQFELEPHDKPYALTMNLKFENKEKKVQSQILWDF